MTFTKIGAVVGVAAMLTAVGCSDDDAAAGDVERYCELARELDEQDGFPTVDQLEQISEAAPEEIAGDVEFVATELREAIEAGDPGAAFSDPELEERFGPIEAFDARECGISDDGEGEEEDEESEQDPSVTQLDPEAARVDVTATEFAFGFEPPSAGRTSFVMVNDGEQSHVMLVARLAEGATLEDALGADDPDEFVEEEYESDTAAPGDEVVVTVDLTAGEWAMVCYLPDVSGEPHFALGMAETFTVT